MVKEKLMGNKTHILADILLAFLSMPRKALSVTRLLIFYYKSVRTNTNSPTTLKQ